MSSSGDSYTFRVGISLVIHNRLQEVEKTLGTLEEEVSDLDRVCLVDNGSTNRESLIQMKKRFHQFHWMENMQNMGFGAGHHQALNWLMDQNCQYLLLLNPDLSFPKGFLDSLIHESRGQEDHWVLGPLLVHEAGDDPVIDSAGLELDGCFRARDCFQGKKKSEAFNDSADVNPLKVQALCGAVLFIPSRLMPLRPEALVFSPEYFAYFEDLELGLELERRRVPMGLLPHLHVVHRRGGLSRLQNLVEKDWQSRPNAVRGAILNRYRTWFRHFGLLAGLFHYPKLLPYEWIRWTFILLRKPWLLKLIPEILHILKEERFRMRHPPIRIPG